MNEQRRLAQLEELEVMDSEPEPTFDEIVRMASDVCDAPISLVSLIDAHRQWFKANLGLVGMNATARDISFCDQTCQAGTLLEIHDAQADPRFSANPLVIGNPGIRFYAGAPIKTSRGEHIGAVCVIDRKPRALQAHQRAALLGLSRIAAIALEERLRRLKLVRELKASEIKFEAIVESQAEMVSIAELDGTLQYVNSAYARLLGLELKDVVGQNFFNFVPEEERDQLRSMLAGVSAERSTAGAVNRVVGPDGRQYWVEWTNRLIQSGDDDQRLIQSVGRDVTAQRLAEQALAESEARFRKLYEATPAMLHSIDRHGRLVNVSDAWLQSLGYTRDEVLGRPSTDFLAEESRAHAMERILPDFFARGHMQDVEYRMVRRDGSQIDVLMSAILERDADGVPVRSLAVTRDVTEQRATAASLAETSHLMQLVLDSLPARVSYWDAKSRIQFGNQSFRAEFRLGDPVTFVGQHVRDLLGEEVYGRLKPAIDKALAGEPTQLEVSNGGDSNALGVTDLRFMPDVVDGNLRGVFVLALDVSAQRQAERELADQNARFRILVDGVQDYSIYMLDRAGRVATWNTGAERATGYSSEQVLGKSFEIFFTSDDQLLGVPERELLIATQAGRFDGEGWRCRSDGTRYWTSVSVSALHGPRGEVIGFAKIARDLTLSRQQQTLVDRAVELAPCGMLIVDPEGITTMINAHAEHLFGYSRGELIGQPFNKLLAPEQGNVWPDFGPRSGGPKDPAAGSRNRGYEILAVRQGGGRFPVEIGLSPIDSEFGPATLVAVFDLTEQLRQRSALERALAEKETLLREVYHRVKNNLQVVQSMLSLQRRALSDQQSARAIDECAQRVRSMALVHEKLYQSGSLTAVSLREYACDLIEQIAQANGARQRNIAIDVAVDDIHTGLDNAIPFGLLLTELITNALKHAFARDAGGTIQVVLAGAVGSNDALLMVADNGKGFDGFDASEKSGNSMGWQLALALTRQLGGELQWKNESGARVSARLPNLSLA